MCHLVAKSGQMWTDSVTSTYPNSFTKQANLLVIVVILSSLACLPTKVEGGIVH